MAESTAPPRGAFSATAANTIASSSAGTPNSSAKRLVALDVTLARVSAVVIKGDSHL